ncbi:hypothetical protein LEMLEM_LOCUS14293 [Lemmus lemmus]
MLAPRSTAVLSAPRPSPACLSWQGMRKLAAVLAPRGTAGWKGQA